MTDAIIPNTCWQHRDGCIYMVLMLANTEGDDPEKQKKYPPTVVYKSIEDGKIWARRLDNWHRSMKKYTPIKRDLEI